MKIAAITQDQLILIDGVPALLGELGGYRMERGEWAVHFDTLTGIGQIEYFDNRQNQLISNDEFNKHYTWLIEEHQRYQDHKAAELAAEEAANAANEIVESGSVSNNV